jgi:hypothetical protein
MESAERKFVFNKIQLGKLYPLSVMEQHPSQCNNTTISLQYNFKPASLNLQEMGTLKVYNNEEAVVEHPKKDNSCDTFKGTASSTSSISGQENEWLLIFDHGTFQIRKVDTSVLNLRHMRDEQTNFIGINTCRAITEQRNLPQLLRKVGDATKAKNKRKVDEISIVNTPQINKEVVIGNVIGDGAT